MKGFLSLVFLLLNDAVLFSESSAAVLDREMARYQVILERNPFGSVQARNTAPDQAEQMPVQPQKALALDWQLTVVTTGPYGTRVGLHNVNSKLNYFAYVGDVCEDGVVVQDADFEKETVTLARGDYVETIGMYSAAVAAEASDPRRSSARMDPRKKFANQEFGEGLSKEEYEATKHLRPPPAPARESIRPTIERLQGLDGAAKEAEFRRYNMDLIRLEGSAGVPFPMALTSEEDAQLVAEGVLPPL